MALYFKDIEITNIDNLVPQTGLDITDMWFGTKNVYTVWAIYEGTLPATLNANGDDMRQYQIYGNTGGVGDDSGTAYGYEVDMSVFGNYKRVHEDTVTINGIVWDILGYDHDIVYKSNGTLAQHTVTIQTHESLSSMLFDAREALFAFDNGLPAGTYFFTVGSQPWYSADISKNIQFTLANDIPHGGQLVINNTYNATMINATISAYANNTAITASETVTMIEGNSGLNLGTVDAVLSDNGICNSIQRAFLGSNRWSQSAIRQYLNSSSNAGSVWTPQTKFDRPPSWVSNTAGFLHSFDNNFMTVLGTAKKTTALNTITDGGGTETTDDRVFLLSRTEAYAGNEQGVAEGTPYPYYSDFSSLSQAGTGSDSNRKKLLTNVSDFEVYWLRTPERGTARTTRAIGKNGEGTQAGSINLRGISPACTIILDDIVSNDWLKNIFLQSETTPIYIGSDPLGKDEYVDYQAGKVYRKKVVHEDTVTINGIVWDILGYDCDTAYKDDNTLAQHTVTIQTHNCINELQFDAREALFAFPEGLAAGAYHFTIAAQPWYADDIGKTITFTITSAIPAGGQLVLNNNYNATMIGSTISSYSSGSATTAIETVTMSDGSGGTDLGSVDVSLSQDGNTNSIQRALLGSNNWSQSAIRQYLNSAATAGSVWTLQTKFDRPPSWVANTAGFLRNADPEFISALGNTTKITALNTVTDGGGSETKFEKVFLLTRSEVYGGDEMSGGEGAPYPYYANYSSLSTAGTGNDSNRIKYRNGTAKYWWLRSPYVGYANYVRSIFPMGTLNTNNATSNIGVAPACVIILDDIATNSWLQEKFLKPTDPPVPLPALPTVEGKTIVDYAGESQATPEKVLLKYRKENF